MDNPGGLIVAGFVLLVLLALVAYASCVTGAWDDRKAEEYIRMKKEDWKHDHQNPYY